MEITMNDKWISKSNGNDNGNGNGNDTIPPLFEVIKEEKAVSSEEQEEDDFHQDLNQQQQQHQHQHTQSDSNSNSQPNQQQHISQSQCQSQSQSQWQQKERNTTKINVINDDNINDNNGNRNDDEENKIHELRKRLESIRIQRRRIHESKYKECMKQQDRLLERLNIRRRDRNEIIDEYTSTWKGRDSVCLFLDCAKRWNVLNDCFYIWIDGRNEFATINGCRLGGEAFPLPSELLVSARRQQQRQQQQQDDTNNNNNNNNNQTSSRSKWVPTAASISTTEINGNNNNVDSSSLSSQQHQHKQLPPRRRLLGFFSGGNNDTTNVSTALPFQKKISSMISTPQQPIHVRVPWLEVNAALGHACLLLRILQESSSKNGGIGMKFTHELHPMGATSKIGIRFEKSVTASAANGVLAAAAGFSNIYNATTTTSPPYVQPVVYNLFFEESSGFNSFFKNNFRNFNWALQAFLQCIAEAAAQQKDKTIAIPHVIRHYKQSSTTNKNNTDTTTTTNNNNNSIGINDLNGGEWTIGGLSICYPSQQQVAAAVGNNSNNYHPGSGNNNGMTTTSSIALEWTRACRYLLTDLKWLIAYAAKHVDR